MPRSLGKVDPALSRMTKDEIKEIHSRHKRELLIASEGVTRKEDFEVNEEDDDEDVAGPSLSLFQQTEIQMPSSERNRKQNDIARKIADVQSEEDPI